MIDAASRFPTQMGREIGQIPAAVQRVLDEPGQLADVAAAIERAGPRWIMIAGRGTSDHAAVFAQYLFETHLGLPTGLVKPSVTTVYGASLDWRGGLVARDLAVRPEPGRRRRRRGGPTERRADGGDHE